MFFTFVYLSSPFLSPVFFLLTLFFTVREIREIREIRAELFLFRPKSLGDLDLKEGPLLLDPPRRDEGDLERSDRLDTLRTI